MEPTYFIHQTEETGTFIIKFDGQDYWWLGASENDDKYKLWLGEGNVPAKWEPESVVY